MSNIPFQKIDWTSIKKVQYRGETGVAFWQTIQFGGLRIRLVEYSKGYFWQTIGAKRAILCIV